MFCLNDNDKAVIETENIHYEYSDILFMNKIELLGSKLQTAHFKFINQFLFF